MGLRLASSFDRSNRNRTRASRGDSIEDDGAEPDGVEMEGGVSGVFEVNAGDIIDSSAPQVQSAVGLTCRASPAEPSPVDASMLSPAL